MDKTQHSPTKRQERLSITHALLITLASAISLAACDHLDPGYFEPQGRLETLFRGRVVAITFSLIFSMYLVAQPARRRRSFRSFGRSALLGTSLCTILACILHCGELETMLYEQQVWQSRLQDISMGAPIVIVAGMIFSWGVGARIRFRWDWMETLGISIFLFWWGTAFFQDWFSSEGLVTRSGGFM